MLLPISVTQTAPFSLPFAFYSSPFVFQNEIVHLLQLPKSENTPQSPPEVDAPGCQKQEINECDGNSNPSVEWEVEPALSRIASDLKELLNRHRLREASRANSIDPETLDATSFSDQFKIRNGGDCFADINESIGSHSLPSDILIKELSASQSTLNSTVRTIHFNKTVLYSLFNHTSALFRRNKNTD